MPNNLKMPEDNDPINKRILECINPNMNNNIEITNNGGNFRENVVYYDLLKRKHGKYGCH